MNTLHASGKARKILLACGVVGALLYPLTDILAGHLYKGYSFSEQTVSELFAIGAPTSRLVVTLFTLCSVLFIAFARGVWLTSGGNRTLRALALMILGNALNSLVLWNFFPMHMRGHQRTFTDTMHGVLAINPFVLATIVLGFMYFKKGFRYYSIATIILLLATASIAFSYAPLVFTNQPTPNLGTLERISQYAHQLWHAVLALVLICKQSPRR